MVVPIQKLQAADKVLGLAACAALQPWRLLLRRERAQGPPRRILLIKFWGIGSLQLLVPAARHLRARYPSAELTLLTLAENADFARGLGPFDRVRTLDVRGCGWLRLGGRILRLLREIRRSRFDRAFDFEFFTRFSAVVGLASGAAERHGFMAPGVWRGRFHTHTQTFNRYWHVARNFRALAGGENESEVVPDDVAPFGVTEEHRRGLAAVLRSLGLPGDAAPLVLNPNAGALALERRWPLESFGALARRLADAGYDVAMIGSAGEGERTEHVARRAERAAVVSLAGRLTIGELCALLERAPLVVTNDTGPMHLAAALGAPTLGLFGPETPVMYAPIGTRARYLWKPPICSPCINVHENKVLNCIHGRPECLVSIGVEEVLAECDRLLRDEPLSIVTLQPRAPEAPAPAAEVGPGERRVGG